MVLESLEVTKMTIAEVWTKHGLIHFLNFKTRRAFTKKTETRCDFSHLIMEISYGVLYVKQVLKYIYVYWLVREKIELNSLARLGN
mgnify:FL=1